MSRLKILSLMLPPCILFLLLAIPAQGGESKGVPKQVLIRNVNIFDGKTDTLAMSQDVLVEQNLIKQIGKDLQINEIRSNGF